MKAFTHQNSSAQTLPNNPKTFPTTETLGQLWHSAPTQKEIQLYLIFTISLIHKLFRCLTTFSFLLFCFIPINGHYISFVQSNFNSRHRGYHHLGTTQRKLIRLWRSDLAFHKPNLRELLRLSSLDMTGLNLLV